MNVNISRSYEFSEVHGGMNRSGSLAKLIMIPSPFMYISLEQNDICAV